MAATLDLGALGFSLTLDKSGWNKSWADTDKEVTQQSGKLKNFANGIGQTLKVGVAAGAAAAGAAIGAMVKTGIDNARDLDKQMSLFAAHTGASADEIDKVRQTVKELYKVNEDSYEDIAATAEALHNAMGMNADEIAKYAQNYMDYAKVTGQANADAVGAIDDLGDAWNLSADEQVSVMDKILVMQQKYGAGVTDTQNALTRMAPAAKAAGYSMDEAASYLAMFAAAGVDANTASTAFSKALQTVKNPTELKKLIKDIEDCKDPFERAKLASELFGAKAGPQMAQALGEGGVSLEDFIAEMENAAGAVSSASSAYDDNFDTRMALLGKRFGGMATEIGEKLLPIAERLLTWVEAHMPEIESVISSVFDAIGVAISWFSDNIMPSLTAAFDAVWSAVQAVWPVIQEIISGVIQYVTGIIEYFSLLLKGDFAGAWQKYKEIITGIWESIKKIVSAAWDFLKGIFGGSASAIANGLSSAWEGMKTAASNAWSSIKTAASSAWEGIKSAVSGAWDNVKSNTASGLSTLGSNLVTGWANMKTGASTAWEAIKSGIGSAVDGIKSGVSTGFNSVKSTAETVWNNIKSAITTPISAAKDFVGGIIDTIKGWFAKLSFKLPEFQWPKLKLPHFSLVGSFSLSPPSVPKLSIDWYSKGAIFAKPTIFPTAHGLKGVGDVPGGEVVAPLSALRAYIQDAMADVLPLSGALTLVLEVDGMAIAKTQINYMDMLLSGQMTKKARGIVNDL